jgi:hypothetical protein
MSQLIINIKDKALVEKITKILRVFEDDGVEIENIVDDNQYNKKWDDSFIEKNWLEIVRSAHIPENYEKSEQYIEDRVKDWKERGKI